VELIERAGREGVQILCMQEIFTGPYFCAEQNPRWYEAVERIPDGPTTRLMQELARKHRMVIVVPLYEEESAGVYYNTAAVIDADGRYLGKYRKNHIPQCNPGFWEKFYFRPGNLGYPVFDTQYAKVGVYICYDRHFPEARASWGSTAPRSCSTRRRRWPGSPSTCGSSSSPAHAVANAFFVGAINRVGREAPWNIGEFYGQSYFCDPRGRIVAEAARDRDELVTAELDLDQIREVRNVWQFSARDRGRDVCCASSDHPPRRPDQAGRGVPRCRSARRAPLHPSTAAARPPAPARSPPCTPRSAAPSSPSAPSVGGVLLHLAQQRVRDPVEPGSFPAYSRIRRAVAVMTCRARSYCPCRLCSTASARARAA
jgi:N-carbamoylputrescine amidase